MPDDRQLPATSAAAPDSDAISVVQFDPLIAFSELRWSGVEETVNKIRTVERLTVQWPRLAGFATALAVGGRLVWHGGAVANGAIVAGLLAVVSAGAATLVGGLLLRWLLPVYGVPRAVGSEILRRTAVLAGEGTSWRLVDRRATMLQAARQLQREVADPPAW